MTVIYCIAVGSLGLSVKGRCFSHSNSFRATKKTEQGRARGDATVHVKVSSKLNHGPNNHQGCNLEIDNERGAVDQVRDGIISPTMRHAINDHMLWRRFYYIRLVSVST